jgi:F0F1-type ATP synthase assembly protein I
MQTRLFRIIQQLFSSTGRKLQRFQKNFAEIFVALFSGFLLGNTFGMFLTPIREVIPWDGATILLALIICEVLGKFVYQRTFNKVGFWFQFLKFLNSAKIGVFFGFFIDAFKVGS